MTRAGLFGIAALSVAGGVACDSESDESSKGLGGGAAAAGVAGEQSGAGASAGTNAPAMSGGSSGATADEGSADAGVTGPIVGVSLATFDTTLDGFILNPTISNVIVGNNGVQTNLGSVTTGLPLAGLSHDATAGSPTPGCLVLTAPFSGACCEFAEVLVAVAGVQDWSGAVLHARVRVASGTFAGVAQLLATSSTVTYGWITESVASDGSWQELTLDVSQPPRSYPGFDATHIIEFGLQFHVGENLASATTGPVVFQIDSFSLERRSATSDAAADTPADAASP